VRIWKIRGSYPIKVAQLSVQFVADFLTFSPNDRFLVVPRSLNSVQMWDWAANKLGSEFSVQGAVCAAAFSPDGSQIAVGSTAGYATISPSTESGVDKEACKRLGSYFKGGVIPLGLSASLVLNTCTSGQ